MALTNWANGDLFSALRDKINLIVALLTGGTLGQVLKSNGIGDPTWTTIYELPSFTGNANKELKINAGATAVEYYTKASSQTAFSGSQGVTSSYVNVGSITYTTPNDGVSRTYMITGEIISQISSGVGDNSIDFKIRNSTDSTDLKTGNIAFPDVQSGSAARVQISLVYLGAPGINKTIVLMAKKSTANGISIISGSLTAIEVSR